MRNVERLFCCTRLRVFPRFHGLKKAEEIKSVVRTKYLRLWLLESPTRWNRFLDFKFWFRETRISGTRKSIFIIVVVDEKLCMLYLLNIDRMVYITSSLIWHVREKTRNVLTIPFIKCLLLFLCTLFNSLNFPVSPSHRLGLKLGCNQIVVCVWEDLHFIFYSTFL